MAKPTLIHVPPQPDRSVLELAEELNFDTDVAKQLSQTRKQTRWQEDHLVWLYPYVHQEPTLAVCVHTLYSEMIVSESGIFSLLSCHDLYCLAAHLKRSVIPQLSTFSGMIHAFGGVALGEKQVLNHREGTASNKPDLFSSVLDIVNGQPTMICEEWHSDPMYSDEARFTGFCGSTRYFNLEEERQRLAT